jgi:hypothetical protein
MDHCLAPPGDGGFGIGSDNMTVVIVALLMGQSDEALRAKCALPPRAPLAHEVVGQNEGAMPTQEEASGAGSQRRVFFGSVSGASGAAMLRRAQEQQQQEDDAAGTMEADDDGAVRRPAAPMPMQALRIPARVALELLLGMRGGGDGDGDSNAALEEDDSVEVDGTPVPDKESMA